MYLGRTDRNQEFLPDPDTDIAEKHFRIHLPQPAKTGLRNNDKNLTCINLYIFILPQVNSEKKDQERW